MKCLYLLLILGLSGCDSPSGGGQKAEDTLSTSSPGSSTQPAPERDDANLNNPMKDTLYVVSGTEPFWSAAIGSKQMIYTSAEGDSLHFSFSRARTAAGRGEAHIMVYDLPEGQKLILQQVNCPCQDGMSSNEYQYEAVLILKDSILEGCGESEGKSSH